MKFITAFCLALLPCVALAQQVPTPAPKPPVPVARHEPPKKAEEPKPVPPKPCCTFFVPQNGMFNGTPKDWAHAIIDDLNLSSAPHAEVNALLSDLVRQYNEQQPKPSERAKAK